MNIRYIIYKQKTKFNMKKLELEINENLGKVISDGEKSKIVDNNTMILFTPPINEDYWIFRVKVSKKQAVIGFPKFMTIGIGFQHEQQGNNVNLPYQDDTEEIYNHIKENMVVSGDQKIKKDVVIQAIKIIQDVADKYKDAW